MTELEIRNKLKDLNKYGIYSVFLWLISSHFTPIVSTIMDDIEYGGLTHSTLFLGSISLTIVLFVLVLLVKYSFKATIIYADLFDMFMEYSLVDLSEKIIKIFRK